MSGAGSHYFDEQPTVASAVRQVELWLPDGRLVLQTDRGVFGHGVVDTGTKLLAMRAPPLPAPAADGVLLDVGCGTGALALTMARRRPDAQVWAVDVNARARELCASNAATNGLTNVRVAAPDEVPADISFATMWSNPPIRIGKPELHRLLLAWLGRLAPEGLAVLVVHKHLGADSLQRWLVDAGWPTTRSTSSRGYRLLHVHPPPPAPDAR